MTIVALVVVVLLVAWAFQSRTMAPLELWHTVEFENEFAAGDATPEFTLRDYVAREDALFAEVTTKIYDRTEPTVETLFSRYRTNGAQDPRRQKPDWNHTVELNPNAELRGGVLLLHGLTDSPYSLRRIGELFVARGYYVVALRLPGHGTTPGALVDVNWRDWVAASRVGARAVHARIGEAKPFVIAGYSNGGGLAVTYALDTLTDSTLPKADALVLLSPEIGIAPIAVISNAGRRLTYLPYFEQFKWLSIEPEYDPYKYNSFPKNAAENAWQVTQAVERGMEDARRAGRSVQFPRVLTFLSWTDSTVETSSTIGDFYDHLENPDSELVIFDVNRFDTFKGFMPPDEDAQLDALQARTDLPYRLTVVGNLSAGSRSVAARSKAARGGAAAAAAPLGLEWPLNVYSLSHVAIPFAPDDPIYGERSAASPDDAGLPLGDLEPRGETHVLTVSLSQLMRLRYNPFFAYVASRIEGLIAELHAR
jgi:alpha-beta hydrolase superfamily lysophospholipase